MSKRHVAVMNTAFRDGFQSVFGARVFRDDFLPAIEAAQAETPHFPGYLPEIVSTASGRDGVILYTRITPQLPETTR